MSIKDIREKSKPYLARAKDRGFRIKTALKNKLLLVTDHHFSSDLFIFLVIILIGLIGFGLGRLSVLESPKQDLDIKKLICPISTSDNNKLISENNFDTVGKSELKIGQQGMLVASKNGTKYYFPWCAGVARISDVNKVWYNSYEEARASGKTPASGCLGLK